MPKRKTHVGSQPRTRAAKRETLLSEVRYGPVLIAGGPHTGQVGNYDDDDDGHAIVYFGDFLLTDGYFMIPRRLLKYATLDAMLKRREEIQHEITWANTKSRPNSSKKYDRLAELHYIDGAISERMFFARYGEPTQDGKKLFMSHSSKDKWFVRRVADDLKKLGHDVWLDEHRIKVGDSIPRAIQKGIKSADFLIIFLSPNSVFSNWVENEWVSKFLDEVESGDRKIIPALIGPCEIPTLLKAKKYADFTKNYDEAFSEILDAIS
jgi:hypothetical protein